MWSLEQEEANSETGDKKPVFCFQKERQKTCFKEWRVEMKKLIGFFAGMAVGLIVVLVIFHSTAPVSADSGSPATSDENTTTTASGDNGSSTSLNSTDLNSLMPDVKKIYLSALGAPYRQVESEITDPDIANYFHRLMNETGLDKVGLDQK
jgi:hypothetical protein